jgi:hypothetical protein
MNLRFFAIGASAVFAAVAASSDVAPARLVNMHHQATPGTARLYAIGTRSAAQRQNGSTAKMDSVLADLSRHASLARPAQLLADLRSLSPAARFAQLSAGGVAYVAIDATTLGDPRALEASLVALGLQKPAVYSNDVGGLFPVNQLGAAVARGEVASIRAAMSRRRAGAVASQGDFAQRSSVVRTNYPTLLGTGVTVGVLSDSFDCYSVYAAPGSGVPVSGNEGYAYNGFTADYATDVSSGALPSGVDVLEEASCLSYYAPAPSPQDSTYPPFSDEGRAMLQIVHAVAPGAGLAFYTAENSEADFASGIGKLAAAGAKVIADDVGYFDEPFFQDGLLAQAVDAVEAQGVAYFSAAGNNSDLSYQNTAPSFTAVSSSGPNAGEHLLNFDRTGATNTTSLPITVPAIPPGDFIAVVVEWDQPYVTGAPSSGGATSSIDLCVTGGTGAVSITDYDGNTVSCTGPNSVGSSPSDPYQIMIIGNPATASASTSVQNLNITVGLAANSLGTIVPGRIIVSVEDDGLGSSINQFATHSATLQGHPGAAGAAAVGAAFYFQTPACGTTPAALEPFSSQGGAPILFDTSGTRLATPLVRQKPDFVGPDGVNNTFLGFTLASDSPPFPSTGMLSTSISQCQNEYNPAYPNFFGTSAATPHAAGIAALMLQANSASTPSAVYQSLRSSALPMSTSSPNFSSGYGFIRADTALVIPTLSLSVPSIALGLTATLTWTSASATGCTASASGSGTSVNWSGPQAPSGSLILTPTAAGTQTYTLTCANSVGTSASSSAILPVTSGTPPATPTLTLGSPSVTVGSSTTLAWSSTGATGCTASGAWSGALAASGSETITPTAVGPQTYTLTCSNLGGPSAAANVTLTATPNLVIPAAPTLTLGSASIPADTTTTISWSSSNATSCTAGGSTNAIASGWTGVLGASGQNTVTPVTLGTFTYTLYCTNAAGKSPTTTVNLTVTESKNTGGGGALDELTLAGLGVLGLWRALARRKSAVLGG